MSIILGKNGSLPVLKLQWKFDSGGYITTLSDLYLCPHEVKMKNEDIVGYSDLKQGDAGYISNLVHLGLIERTYLEHIVESSHYEALNNLPEVIANKEECEKSGYKFVIKKGLARLTPFGENFVNICCSFGEVIECGTFD